jgi:hypothetical protein
MFKTNVGSADRIIRVVVGLALIAAYAFTSIGGTWHVALLIGIVPLLTGLLSTCPIYSILGMSTCPMKR